MTASDRPTSNRYLRSYRDEIRLFPRLPFGPVSVRWPDGRITATTADGPQVELSADTPLVRHQITRADLARGVEVRIDGAPAGHLTWTGAGWRRRDRVIHLVGREPGRFPPGAHFRLRGLSRVSLEDDRGRIVGFHPAPLQLITGRPRYHRADVGPELVALLAAAQVNLLEPLQLLAPRGNR